MIDYGRRRAGGVWRRVRNISIGTTVVLVLLVGAGVAYTWYMGLQSNETETVAVIEPNERPAGPTPSKADPEGVVGIAKQALTSPVPPGENASFTIKTNPEADCDITVTYGELGDEEKESTDSGLVAKTANNFGVIEWTWTIESNREVGEYPIAVTCKNEAKSAYYQDVIKVAFPEEE